MDWKLFDAASGQLLDEVTHGWLDPRTGHYAKHFCKQLYYICKPDGQAVTDSPLAEPKLLGTTSWVRAKDPAGYRYNLLLSPSGRLVHAPDDFEFVDQGPNPGVADPAKLGAAKIRSNGWDDRYLSLSGKKLYQEPAPMPKP